MPSPTKSKFDGALAALIAQVEKDRSILAAVLCGSLAHDTVWQKSDIDLFLVTIDDRKADKPHLALNADGVNVHAFLMTRTEFRQTAEGTIRNSFMHSLLAKGRLIYTHDPTIATLVDRLQEIGERDAQVQLLSCACQSLPPIDKARKWFVTRGDLDYTALWILHSATALARIEVISARQLVGREVIQQAMQLNPKFFKQIYSDLLNTKKTKKNVEAALDAIDKYLATRAEVLFAPLLAHLKEVGEARSATEIENHFIRNHGIEGITTACEYLADNRLITKVSLPVQLTRRSNIQVEELAFAYAG